MAPAAASAHCWLTHTLLSTKFPGPFQQSCSPDSQAVLSPAQHRCAAGREEHGFFLLEGRSSQLRDFAFVPSVFDNMLARPFLEFTFQCINCSCQFRVTCKLDDSTPSCLFWVVREVVKQGRSQQISLHHST